jgi:putative transcriptional regulator
MIYNSSVRNEVRSVRRRVDMTQLDLARAVGVSRQTIISIEQGRYRPSVELALRIARTLRAGVEELFILEDDE